MIEELCLICEEQAVLIRSLALHLGEIGDITMSDQIAAVDAKYRAILGVDEPTEPSSVCPGPSPDGPGPIHPYKGVAK